MTERKSEDQRTPATLQEWRERREARRIKQRIANVARAEKMHDARLADAESRPCVPNGRPTTDLSETPFHVGCSGWFYWHWRDRFYPPGTPTSGWFRHYAKNFDTVELNAPFYSWPTVGTVNAWSRQVRRKRFVYSVKVCELITHVKRFRGTARLVEDFGWIGDLLGPRMGCFLFQLPPSFHYTPARLRGIISQLDPRWRNVVEFRHRSWWTDRVYSVFREAGAIFCSCSAPRLPDELIKTADEIYIRFHGKARWYRHDYTKAELEVWTKRVADSGAKRVWAYFNNDREGYAIKNARALKRQLRVIFPNTPARRA